MQASIVLLQIPSAQNLQHLAIAPNFRISMLWFEKRHIYNMQST